MRVTQFTYERRLNLGDYNHKGLSAIAVLDDGECPHIAAKALMEVVDIELLGKPAPAPKTAPVVEEKVVAKIPPKKKEVVAPVVEEKKEEPAPVVAKEEPAAKEEAPVVEKKATSAIPYDRNNDAHKKAFTDYLFATYGNNADSKKKGGSFSRAYEGKPMLDAKSGTLLEEFKTALATAMAQ